MPQDGFLPYPKGFATDAIHHSQEPEQWDSMAIVAPIVTSTTYKKQGPADFAKYEYSRAGNPTRKLLENILAKLDNAKHALAFASGMGATAAILGLLKSGEHIVSDSGIYAGTNILFNQMASKFGIKTTLVDFCDVGNFEKEIRRETKVVWIEMPTNPTMRVVDIAAVVKVAKNHNLMVVVDNTFLTPYLMRSLNFGVDIVAYSLTKYINGHSDVVMGALVTSSDDLYEKLRFMQICAGAVPSPIDCYQVIRGLKTLALRMEKHKQNSLTVAKFLERHAKVEKVLHPSLPSHPQHELFKKQTSGHSGVFSFYLKDGDLEKSKKFLTAVKVFALAGSLGGYESLIQLPYVMSHDSVPAEHKIAVGITDSLIRLSVGIEDEEDLIADLAQAFDFL